MTPEVKDHSDVVRDAEAELNAQLAIVRLLKRLDRPATERVMTAVLYLLEADKLVPGVLLAVRNGIRLRKGGSGDGDGEA
jgi:L-fucose mutarotase/ribose pyranase (RbsD/FucU family)